LQPTKRKILKRIALAFGATALAVVLLIVLAVADVLGAFHEPPLWIEQNPSAVIVHVENLGEYCSFVGRIRIQEASSGQVVYEAEAENKKPKPAIFNFKLVAGANSTRLFGDENDSYRILEPRVGNTFSLQRGIKYRITVWGDSWTFRRSSFVL
jgi:hypothetical protein